MSIRSLSFVILLSALPVLAQEAPAAPPAAAKVGATPPVIVTLSFAGGTLADFCAQIRAKEPRANIVVSALAAGAKLPPMDLRGAGLEQALEGVCAVAESAALIRMKDFRGPGEPVFTISAQQPVMAVARGGPGGPSGPVTAVPGTAPGQRLETTEVYSLNRLLEPKDGTGFTATTVLSAIEAAALGEQSAAPTLRFHKESGLLIVRGTVEQVAVVRDVLGSLERDVSDRRKQDQARKAAPGEAAKDAAK